MRLGKATFNVAYLKTLTYDEIEAIYGSGTVMFSKALKVSGVKKPRSKPKNKKSDKSE